MSDNLSNSDMTYGNYTVSVSHRSDEILGSLSNTQRRRVMLYLQEEDSASKSEIVHHLITWKYDSHPDEVSDKAVKRVRIDLHHKHLPKLEDAGLIEYDRRSEMVLVRDLPELAELCLDHCESADLPS
jgi:DNA-binding transcriptional ArsR family regulator